MLENDKKKKGGEASVESLKEQDLTRLLIDYLYDFFPVYQEIKDKSWTRENELDELISNTSQSHSLRKLLTDPRTVCERRKGVIVFRGEKEGDGKKFYLNKLIETCYEAIPHFVWSDMDKMEEEGKLFRFPILVDKEAVECWLKEDDEYDKNIAGLTAQCFMTKLKLETDVQRSNARKLAEKLLQKGMLALFVMEDVYFEPIRLVQRLISVMPDTDLMPILIFLVDNSFSSEVREGEEEQFYCIDIKPLTEYQILRYIAIELPDCPELMTDVKEHKEIIKLLSKQERLLKQIAIWKNNKNIQKEFKLDILQIENDFIKEMTGDNEELHKRLCKAAKLELCDKEIPQETLNEFSKTDFFYNGRFNYAESKYYLVAEEYVEESETLYGNALPKTIDNIIRKWPVEVQMYFATFYIYGDKPQRSKKEKLKFYYNKLCDVLNNSDLRQNCDFSPAVVIADTLLFLGKAEEKLNDFVDWVAKELENPNYDKKVFEALSHIRDAIPDSRIEDVLCEKYKKIENPGVKRRIVYFYSWIHYPVPDEIIEDLVSEENKDIHLKCHIISALIDTLDAACIEERKWKRDGAYVGWVQRDYGPILQSQLEKVYFLISGKLYKSDGEALTKKINDLLKVLSDAGDDWEKAHAADALCKMAGLDADNIKYIIGRLNQLLIKDLEELSVQSEYNCLRPIRYLIEACCMLAVHESTDDTVLLVVQERFAEPIQKFGREYISSNTPFRKYILVYSVFSMLICGLAYLKNSKLPIRELLDRQFLMERSLNVLLEACSIKSTSELWPESCADELEDIIQEWKEQLLLFSDSSSNMSADRMYDSSVGQIYEENEYVGMGFLFREYSKMEYHVYCITCRHLFQKEYLEKIAFEPLDAKENPKKYPMKLIYPKQDKFGQELSPRTPAKEDVSIWEVNDIPYNMSWEIYDKSNWYDGSLNGEMQLRSYGFPNRQIADLADAHGWPLEYKYVDKRKGEFYTFTEKESLSQQRNQIYNSNKVFCGYSGAPIVDSIGRICAMHKGNEGEVLIGIASKEIQKILEEKEWEQHE